MNTLQMKQKMLELGVSDTYMAECCGVGVQYFRQIFAGTKPMTNKLKQKVEGVFKTLLIKPKSAEEQPKEQPKMVAVTDKSGTVELKNLEEERQKKEREVEFYRGQLSGLFLTLEIVGNETRDKQKVYSQDFVNMLCEINRHIREANWNLIDLLLKKEGE